MAPPVGEDGMGTELGSSVRHEPLLSEQRLQVRLKRAGRIPSLCAAFLSKTQSQNQPWKRRSRGSFWARGRGGGCGPPRGVPDQGQSERSRQVHAPLHSSRDMYTATLSSPGAAPAEPRTPCRAHRAPELDSHTERPAGLPVTLEMAMKAPLADGMELSLDRSPFLPQLWPSRRQASYRSSCRCPHGEAPWGDPALQLILTAAHSPLHTRLWQLANPQAHSRSGNTHTSSLYSVCSPLRQTRRVLTRRCHLEA